MRLTYKLKLIKTINYLMPFSVRNDDVSQSPRPAAATAHTTATQKKKKT